jgi:hypothetical protein
VCFSSATLGIAAIVAGDGSRATRSSMDIVVSSSDFERRLVDRGAWP